MPMGNGPTGDKGVFRARLEQDRGGLFRAIYRGDLNATEPRTEVEGEGPQVLPDMHIGTDPDAVRVFVETLARDRGYSRVVWEE
jgi:hypothetical protein